MNNQLIEILNSATGIARIVDFVKILTVRDVDMSLNQVLIISRVLFAVVMNRLYWLFF